MNLKTVMYTQLNIGNIVRFNGARFEITSFDILPDTTGDDTTDIVRAVGVWLDGAIEPGYFGPKQDWVFQGNYKARIQIEVE